MTLRLCLQPTAHAPAPHDEPECVLGCAVLGNPASAPAPADWPTQAIAAPLLGSGAEWLCDVWRGAGACAAGESNGIAWRRAGGVLYGVIEIDEDEFAIGTAGTALQAATREAYLRVFRLLDAQGMPHLWRAWNYLAHINRTTYGLERYRQFNIGRQDAFLASHRGTSGQVPAACAIGLAGGPLSIAFLAGEAPVLAVENPRQISAYHYPAQYGLRSPTFSRAVLAHPPGQEILFLSGTASIVGHHTVHAGDVAAQCKECLTNVAAVVEAANRSARSGPFSLAELDYRVYVRHAHDFPPVRQAIRSQVPGDARIVFLQADICRPDLLLEIEAAGSHSTKGSP